MKSLYSTLTSGLLLMGMVSTTLAETALTPKAQYTADSKTALTRYEADKALCNDETSSTARLQCRRDAKIEYDKALAAAKAQMAAATAAPVSAKTQTAKVACSDCGRVIAVSMTEKEGEGGAVGMIAGGVTGALLGRQVGGGFGKDLATIAGAAGGAYAGKKIEEKVKTHNVWTVSVQYGDGHKKSFDFDKDPGLKVGDAVKNSGNTIVRD
jgi:outer membrane lipoprotein SlyB